MQISVESIEEAGMAENVPCTVKEGFSLFFVRGGSQIHDHGIKHVIRFLFFLKEVADCIIVKVHLACEDSQSLVYVTSFAVDHSELALVAFVQIPNQRTPT